VVTTVSAARTLADLSAVEGRAAVGGWCVVTDEDEAEADLCAFGKFRTLKMRLSWPSV
jgi:hypothetical protein